MQQQLNISQKFSNGSSNTISKQGGKEIQEYVLNHDDRQVFLQIVHIIDNDQKFKFQLDKIREKNESQILIFPFKLENMKLDDNDDDHQINMEVQNQLKNILSFKNLLNQKDFQDQQQFIKCMKQCIQLFQEIQEQAPNQLYQRDFFELCFIQQNPQKCQVLLVPTFIQINKNPNCEQQFIIVMHQMIYEIQQKNEQQFWEQTNKVNWDILFKNAQSSTDQLSIKNLSFENLKENQEIKLAFLNSHFAIYICTNLEEKDNQKVYLLLFILSKCIQNENKNSTQNLSFFYQDQYQNLEADFDAEKVFLVSEMKKIEGQTAKDLLEQYESQQNPKIIQLHQGLNKNFFFLQRQYFTKEFQQCNECTQKCINKNDTQTKQFIQYLKEISKIKENVNKTDQQQIIKQKDSKKIRILLKNQKYQISYKSQCLDIKYDCPNNSNQFHLIYLNKDYIYQKKYESNNIIANGIDFKQLIEQIKNSKEYAAQCLSLILSLLSYLIREEQQIYHFCKKYIQINENFSLSFFLFIPEKDEEFFSHIHNNNNKSVYDNIIIKSKDRIEATLKIFGVFILQILGKRRERIQDIVSNSSFTNSQSQKGPYKEIENLIVNTLFNQQGYYTSHQRNFIEQMKEQIEKLKVDEEKKEIFNKKMLGFQQQPKLAQNSQNLDDTPNKFGQSQDLWRRIDRDQFTMTNHQYTNKIIGNKEQQDQMANNQCFYQTQMENILSPDGNNFNESQLQEIVDEKKSENDRDSQSNVKDAKKIELNKEKKEQAYLNQEINQDQVKTQQKQFEDKNKQSSDLEIVLNDRKYNPIEIEKKLTASSNFQYEIVKIEMGDQRYSDQDLAKITKQLQKYSALKYFSINLENSSITKCGFESIFKSLFEELQVLSADLSQSQICLSQTFDVILQNIGKFKQLISLKLYLLDLKDDQQQDIELQCDEVIFSKKMTNIQ